ncbi:MAG TPA: pitrilysin family protein [Planctomycetota bacterium]|nr:pitrilysin family protein [Planctomycetota bacterium]
MAHILVAADAPPPAPVAEPAGATAGSRWAFTAFELKNGLRVIVQEDHRLPVCAVQVRYHVGSKDESPDRQGFAHMFEHMMFRGTERVKPEEHMEFIRLMGGNCNASTSEDRTEYHETFPAEKIEKVLWLEAERMVNLKVDQEGYEIERKVVIEEYRERVANRPTGHLFEDFSAQFYKVHPYRWETIGKPEHLMAAKIEELQAFYKKFYQPNNAVLVIVGDVKAADMRETVARLFGNIPRGGEIPRIGVREDPNTTPTTIDLHAAVPIVATGFAVHAPHDYTRESVALDFLSSILGDDRIGRLPLRMVHRDKIALGTRASYWTSEQDGLFLVGAGGPPGTDLGKLQQVIDEEIARLLKDGVTADEVERIRTQELRSIVTDTLSVMDRAAKLGEAACEFGDANLVAQREDWVKTVAVDDINAAARKYLKLERRWPGSITPPGNAIVAAPAADPKALGGVPPAPAEKPNAAPSSLPIPEDFKMDNGLRVLFLHQTVAPMITVQLSMPNGSQKDPEGKEGLAAYAAELLLKGTAKHTTEALETLLADHAIRMGAGSDRDDSVVRVSCLTKEKDLAFQLLTEVLTSPQFEAGAFKVAKDQRLSRLKYDRTEPRSMLDKYYYKTLYSDHPYGRWWTTKSTQAIAREDVVKYQADSYVPNGATLVVVGDLSREELNALLQGTLATWASKGTVENKGLDPITPATARIVIVNMKGAAQSVVRAGKRTAIPRADRAYTMSTVLAEIFGGSMSSRINKSLRVEGGLTYGAFSNFSRSRRGQDFRIGYSTKTESTGDSLVRMINVLKGSLDNAATEEELAGTKLNLRGEFVLSLEEPSTLARLYSNIAMYGLPLNYYDQYLSAVGDAKVPELQDIANTAMKDLLIVIVGDAEKIMPQLKPLNLPVDILEPDED